MPIAESLFSGPRRHALVLPLSLGLALGFYPGSAFFLAAFGAALILVSLARAACALGLPRSRNAQALALGVGLLAGSCLAWLEDGRLAPAEPAHAPTSSGSSSAPRAALAHLEPAWAEGRLVSDSSPAKNGFRSYPIEVECLGLAGRGAQAELSYPKSRHGSQLRLLARAGPEIDAGSLVRASGSFSAGGASNEGAAASAATSGQALFARPRDILLVDRGGALDRARSSVREACRAALARVGKRSSGLMQALILGVKDSLAPEEGELFKAAGCSHILALSGEHLSVLAVVAIAALSPLVGPVRAKLGGAVIASLFMWIAGPGPSLLRAVLMVWIGAIALALDRPQLWLETLALAFCMTLPVDPAGARSLSFVLSYLAVWGLAVLAPRFFFLLGKILPPFLRESAAASLAAQAAVSPVLAFTFGYLQFAGIPAAMAAAPLVTAMMWWGMGSGLVCSLIPAAVVAAVPVSDLLYDGLMAVMRAASAFPVLSLPSFPLRLLSSAVVVALALVVYARPHAEYRARLRLAPRPPGPPRDGGPRDVQALRSEFPGE